jgi:hypothetical protein
MPPLEDRVVSSAELRAFNEGTVWRQLGPGILNGLEDPAFHVVVPAGHLHSNGDDDHIMAVVLQLRSVDAGSLSVWALIPPRMFRSLPSAFTVLGRIGEIAGAAVAEADEWLYELGEHPDET